MLGAIKLPSGGVSQDRFSILQGPLPYVEVIGPNYLEVCGAVEPKRGQNQLSSSVYANKTLRHGSGNQHIWIKNGVESNQLEDLMVLKRSPDLLNNVKIGQDQLWLIMKHILFYGGCGHLDQVTQTI